MSPHPAKSKRRQPVSLEIKGDSLTLKAKGKNDWTVIPIPAKVDGLPVCVSMNRTYLAKALKFGFAQIDIEDHVSPMVCSAKGKIMVICPLSSGDKKAPAGPPIPPTSPPENVSQIPANARRNSRSKRPRRSRFRFRQRPALVASGLQVLSYVNKILQLFAYLAGQRGSHLL